MFNLKPEERFSDWRNFRQTLSGTIKEQLTQVVNYWSPCPLGSRYIDYYSPKNWPTPWEILHDSLFCQNTIALCMYYTLKFSENFDNNELKIVLIDDSIQGEVYLVVVIDNEFVINYAHNVVNMWAEVKKNVKIIDVFDDKVLDKK